MWLYWWGLLTMLALTAACLEVEHGRMRRREVELDEAQEDREAHEWPSSAGF